MTDSFEGFRQEPLAEEVTNAADFFNFLDFQMRRLADQPDKLAELEWVAGIARAVIDGTKPLYKLSPSERVRLREQKDIYAALERVLDGMSE